MGGFETCIIGLRKASGCVALVYKCSAFESSNALSIRLSKLQGDLYLPVAESVILCTWEG